MSVVGAFVSHLSTITGVVVLVGTRIYRSHAAPDTRTLPYIVVTQTPGTRREYDQTGVSEKVNVQLLVDAFADSPIGAEALGNAIRLRLAGLSNSTIGTVPNKVPVDRVTLDDEFPDIIQSSAGAGIDVYRWNQNWNVWADETAPVLT